MVMVILISTPKLETIEYCKKHLAKSKEIE